ncbi:MAG: SgcJ/EcaC family oxidoreductase [Pedobacter sp.]
MKYRLFLVGFILSAMSVQAQVKNADTGAIEKQVDQIVNSWNRHDYSDMESYSVADCSWVNIVGMVWKGLKEVKYAHQFYHDNMFKNTTMTKKAVSVRMIGATTAIVHFKSYVSEFTTPAGHKMPGNDNMALLVFVKQNGKWLLTAGENVTVDAEAQKHNPVSHMKK